MHELFKIRMKCLTVQKYQNSKAILKNKCFGIFRRFQFARGNSAYQPHIWHQFTNRHQPSEIRETIHVIFNTVITPKLRWNYMYQKKIIIIKCSFTGHCTSMFEAYHFSGLSIIRSHYLMAGSLRS